MKFPQVICAGCGCRRAEKNMEIYNATTDEYFHSQECSDKTVGIEKRDKNGFIVFRD